MASPLPFYLDDFLPYKLVKVAAHVSDSLARIYETEFGISRPEWRILASMGAKDGLNAKSLVTETSMDKVRVSRTLKVLEEKGLVVKVKDEADQRAAYLHLTEEGKGLYLTILPKAKAWESAMLDGISEKEYESFLRTLDALLEKSDADPARAIREP
ncbi:MarR family winged helix-turn-helix transcriptional regulator [Grimontia marina]|uniref:Multidrug resistance operon repressor n=1 Tax=Grimontia marina TaxID=646534 RepID=A0A128F9T8_9GAMM|nr:MarR family winged helix-turn-helix transcriptional regulator [Grimontia marina]CZF83275.1 Multidrug resistance operon repressor [Grimontia marina]